MKNLVGLWAAVAGLACFASLAAAPAHATPDSYAFGYSYYDGNEYLTLNGSTQILTNGVQGWVSPTASNPDGNTNYIVGTCCLGSGDVFSNYFVFNVSGVTGPVTSAALTISPQNIINNFTYVLHDATAYAALLSDAPSPNPALYTDLAQGPILGSFSVTTASNYAPSITFTLNSTGISDLNSIIDSGGSTFAISGTVSGQAGSTGGVPEPTTWVLMLLGVGSIGLSLRARRSVLA
jgi:hypothetical protein